MANERQQQSEGGGCLAGLLVLTVVAFVAMGIISVAAALDPFSGLPPVSEIWEDCEGECDLDVRFPGFWGYVGATLVYVVAAAGSLAWLMSGVADLRRTRPERFLDLEQAKRYGAARRALAPPALASGVLAALPIVVALA